VVVKGDNMSSWKSVVVIDAVIQSSGYSGDELVWWWCLVQTEKEQK